MTKKRKAKSLFKRTNLVLCLEAEDHGFAAAGQLYPIIHVDRKGFIAFPGNPDIYHNPKNFLNVARTYIRIKRKKFFEVRLVNIRHKNTANVDRGYSALGRVFRFTKRGDGI